MKKKDYICENICKMIDIDLKTPREKQREADENVILREFLLQKEAHPEVSISRIINGLSASGAFNPCSPSGIRQVLIKRGAL